MRTGSVTTILACPVCKTGSVKLKATDYPSINHAPPESEIKVLEGCTHCGTENYSETDQAHLWFEALCQMPDEVPEELRCRDHRSPAWTSEDAALVSLDEAMEDVA